MGRTLLKVTFLATIIILGLTTASSVMADESEQQPTNDVTEEGSPPDGNNEYYYGDDSYEYVDDVIVDQDQLQVREYQEHNRVKRSAYKWKRGTQKSAPGEIEMNYVSFTNTAENFIRISCGSSKHVLTPQSEYTFIFRPSGILWCSAYSGNRLMSFAGYGGPAPTANAIRYVINNGGLYHDGKLTAIWRDQVKELRNF